MAPTLGTACGLRTLYLSDPSPNSLSDPFLTLTLQLFEENLSEEHRPFCPTCIKEVTPVQTEIFANSV